LVFDVNETLLDLAALRDPFAQAFGDASPMAEWFVRMLHASLVANETGRYQDFGSLGRAALRVVAERRNVTLDDAAISAIAGGIRRLPAHPEVPDALARLRDAGFTMVTLTNSTSEVVTEQLEHAKIADLFDRSFSVEEIGRFKPAPEPYRMTADGMGVRVGDLLVIAAHDWDIAGAKAAGAGAAFVARPGQVYREGLVAPDLVAKDLTELADRLVAG
jgi:2-haloacid dehalogenase